MNMICKILYHYILRGDLAQILEPGAVAPKAMVWLQAPRSEA